MFQRKTKDEITRLERDVDERNYIDCYFETRKIIECRLRENLLWDREGAKKGTEEDDQGHAPNTKVFPVSDFYRSLADANVVLSAWTEGNGKSTRLGRASSSSSHCDVMTALL